MNLPGPAEMTTEPALGLQCCRYISNKEHSAKTLNREMEIEGFRNGHMA